MGLFTSKNGNAKTARYYRAGLTRTTTDRVKLSARLPEAMATLTLATEERRSHLTIEALDDERGISRDAVDRAQGKVDDIQYLIAQCDEKIRELELGLASAVDHGEFIERLGCQLRGVADDRAGERLREIMGAVQQRFPIVN
jgi:hypothetical protein